MLEIGHKTEAGAHRPILSLSLRMSSLWSVAVVHAVKQLDELI